MHPRYFIGLTLPEVISDKISRIQHDLLVPGKIMDPLVPHITLLDPNSLQSVSPLYLTPKAHETAKEFLPIHVTLTKTNLFHNRVLYLAVESPGLMELHTHLAALLPDKVRSQYMLGRDFVPHITLVQAKPKQNLPLNVIQEFETRISDILPYSYQVTNLTQFTWERPRHYSLKQI